MLASERFSKIVEMTNRKGFISTKELSRELGVTETTIRRDCEELEKKGYIIRVHGGAKSIKQSEVLSNRDEKIMSDRTDINRKEKEIVCEKAASFVRDGDCIFLDGGTSIVPILKYISDKKLKIVTNSMLIANEFEGSNSELFVLGGKYIPEYNMTVGTLALNDIDKFNFDYSFIGCAGVDLERRIVYTAEMDTMAVKQRAVELSANKYMLMDSSKFKVKGFCSFIKSDNFDAIICNRDSEIDEEELPENFIIVDDED